MILCLQSVKGSAGIIGLASWLPEERKCPVNIFLHLPELHSFTFGILEKAQMSSGDTESS